MSTTGPNHPRLPRTPSARAPSAWTRGRRLRWAVRLLLGVPLLVSVLGLGLMRSPLVGWIVASRVRAMSGATFEARRVVIELDGRLTLRDFVLRVPSIPGPAGELMSAGSASLDLDWSGWWHGRLEARGLRLVRPVFRLSQSLEDGSINLAGLAPVGGGGSGVSGGGGGGGSISLRPPQIDALDAKLEFGEHAPTAGVYRTLKSLNVAGSFTPIGGPTPGYRVVFAELGVPVGAGAASPPMVGSRGMVLDGRLDLGTAETELRLSNLTLDAFPPESVPSSFREIWRRLNIQGQVTQMVFTNAPGTGFALQLTLGDVSMDALVPVRTPAPGARASEPPPPPGSAIADERDLALRNVNGTITIRNAGLLADLTGKIQGQSGPSHVVLETQGTKLDSALRCEITGRGLNVTKDPEFLAYVPARVRDYLDIFSGPTAEVDASVTISRGPPVAGQPADFEVSGGRVAFRHGRAAFAKFPYPFAEMRGTVEFDDSKIHFVEIQGVGPTGAKLNADVLIAPLTDTARADVNVRVTGAPVDELLLGSMPPDRRQILDVLLSRTRYDDLVRRGLIPPALAFQFGGLADITVNVQRPEGLEVDWITRISVRFDTIGLVPEPFPLPIIARDVELTITDDKAVLERGDFSGLTGGKATLQAVINFNEHGRRVIRPRLKIEAAGVPVDELLLSAVPEPASVPNANPDHAQPSAKDILQRLTIEGTVDCVAEISQEQSPDTQAAQPGSDAATDYDITVTLDSLRARPKARALPGDPPPTLEIRDLSGSVNLTPDAVSVRALTGRVVRLDAADQTVAQMAITLRAALTPAPESAVEPAPEQLRADIRLTALDLSSHIDEIAGVFSGDAGDLLRRTRENHAPSGQIDGDLTIVSRRAPGRDGRTGPDGGAMLEPETTLSVAFAPRASRDAVLNALGGAISIDDPTGLIRVDTGSPSNASAIGLNFEDAAARLRFDAEPVGEIHIHGTVALDTEDTGGGSGAGRIRSPANLAADLRDWRFESPLARALVSRLGDADARAGYERVNPAGSFDAQVRLSGEPSPTSTPSAPPSIAGWIMPRSLAANLRERRITLDRLTGRITFDTAPGSAPSTPVNALVRGQIQNATAAAPGWSAAGGGAWSYSDSRGLSLDTSLDLTIRPGGLDDNLLAIAPPGLTEAIARLEAAAEGPIEIAGAHLRLTDQGDPALASAEFLGSLRFVGLNADAGVPVRGARGRLDISVLDPPGIEPLTLHLGLAADSLTAAGLRLTDVEGLIETAENADGTGELRVPRLSAACYGGRITLTATVGPSAGSDRKRYEADVLLAGVRFAPVLRDLFPGGEDATPASPVNDADASRGTADASLSIAGIVGQPQSRIGHGALRIANGDVVRLPVVMPLLQVSNLQLPRGDSFNYLQSTLAIEGESINFERIAVLSRSVAIIGAGTLRWADKPSDRALDLRFNTKSTSRVPLWSDLFEAVRDEVLSTTVTGTLDAPVISSEPLTTTRGVLGSMFKPGRPDPIDGTAAEAAARNERSRVQQGPTTPGRSPSRQAGTPLSDVTPKDP